MALEEDVPKELYKHAVEKWGEGFQLRQAKEECAELIVAISHWERGRIQAVDVIEEMVDVQLILNQLRYIFAVDNTIWDTIVELKVNRLRRLLETEGPNECYETSEKSEEQLEYD